MTFSNKISKLIYTYTKYYNSNLVKEIQKEADNYAIDFAEWVDKLRSSEIDTIDYDLYLRYDTKELLEIYKKEKNL